MQSHQSPAGKRYIRRFIPSMVLYVVALFGVTWWFRVNEPEGWLRYAAAAAPALPLLAVIWAMGRYLVEETDEYIRMRLARASLMATGITLALCTVWGFLEQFEVVGHIPLYYTFIIWCAGLGLAQLWAKVTGQ